MPYPQSKVYFDGSHYIAIPHTTRPSNKSKVSFEEYVDVVENLENSIQVEKTEDLQRIEDCSDIENTHDFKEDKNNVNQDNKQELTKNNVAKKMTLKQLFEKFYLQFMSLSKNQKKSSIICSMRPYFKTDKATKEYVELQLERKKRNLICRRIRLVRKVNLQEFNYFCTFTYDGAKHTEESFKKKLQGCFKMMCHRKKWKYVGVWERSPEKKRLHFHGLFYIPLGAMPGELIEVSDYSPVKKTVQHTIQNTYFNERFGRSDFKKISHRTELGNAIAYLLKYIEKSGEKIVYSKGLPQFFVSDIMEDDVVCRIGQEDKKLLLFDNFTCWDEGCYMGTVSKETIEQMPKLN